MNDRTEPKVVTERSPENQRTTNIEAQTGHTEGCHVCAKCGTELGLMSHTHRARGHQDTQSRDTHQDTQSRDTHHAVSAEGQLCSQETQSVSSEETQRVHSVSSEETQGPVECGGTTITDTENVQLGSHSHIYHGPVHAPVHNAPVHNAPVHHAPVHNAPVHNVYHFTINCPDSDPRSLQQLTEAVRGALGNRDDINSPVQQPDLVEAETTLRQIQASSDSPVKQPHTVDMVEAETSLRQIQASSDSPVQQPHQPEVRTTHREIQTSSAGKMEDREDVAIVDSRGQTILPGDAVYCNMQRRWCLYIGGLEMVHSDEGGLVRRGQLYMTQPFRKKTVISGSCPVFSPQERVLRAVEKVGRRMSERELEPVHVFCSRAFLAWV